MTDFPADHVWLPVATSLPLIIITILKFNTTWRWRRESSQNHRKFGFKFVFYTQINHLFGFAQERKGLRLRDMQRLSMSCRLESALQLCHEDLPGIQGWVRRHWTHWWRGKHGGTWWLIPLSKWVISPVINGISRVNPLITGDITHLLSGMSHQVE